MEIDSHVAQWAFVVGFFAPLGLAFIQQSGWSKLVRSATTLAVAAIAAIPTAYFAGDLTGQTWTAAALIILVATIATYQGWWKPSGIAPRIEVATNIATEAPSDIDDSDFDDTTTEHRSED